MQFTSGQGKVGPGEAQVASQSQRIDNMVREVVSKLSRYKMIATVGAFNRCSRWLSSMAFGSKTDLRTPFGATRAKDGSLKYRKRSEIVAAFNLKKEV